MLCCLLVPAGGVQAQNLRLSDILSAPSQEEEESAANEPAAQEETDPRPDALRRLRELRSDLQRRPASSDPSEAESLLSQLPFLQPDERREVLETAWRVFAAVGNDERSADVLSRYRAEFPDGNLPLQASVFDAIRLGEAGDYAKAAATLDDLLTDPDAVSLLKPSGLFLAAESYLRAARPSDARAALNLIPARERVGGTEELRRWWLLETLLYQDDASIAMPAAPGEGRPLHDAIQLRRAMLLSLRGETQRAGEIAGYLRARRTTLSAAETDLLALL